MWNAEAGKRWCDMVYKFVIIVSICNGMVRKK